MTIYDIADLHGKQLNIRRLPGLKPDEPPFIAGLERAEVKEGSFLAGVCGRGFTPSEAVNRYAKEIQGKLLVFDAYRDTRVEIQVPPVLDPIP